MLKEELDALDLDLLLKDRLGPVTASVGQKKVMIKSSKDL
jgi:hypothetical protein